MTMQNQYLDINELAGAPAKRLASYQRQLSRGASEKDGFDENIRDYMIQISKDGGKKVLWVAEYLTSLGWRQNYYDYDKIKWQVENFQKPQVPNRGWRRNFKSVKSELIDLLRSKGTLKSLQYGSKEAVLEALPRLDTHAGYSYILTGKRKKGEYVDNILEDYLSKEKSAKQNKSFNVPILIGSRTQAKSVFDKITGEVCSFKNIKELFKTRLVSMIDIYLILAECKFAKPLQNHLSRFDWYMGGKSDKSIHQLVAKNRNNFGHWLSLDYSTYDQTISSWMIRECFDVVRACFDDELFDDELFEIVINDFIHKVFITADGPLEAHKGVPSGSMFTQIIDSIANYIMIGCYMKVNNINRYSMLIMGDDNLVFTNQPIDKNNISSYLYNEYGAIVNVDKTDQGESYQHPEFLSRLWTYYGPYRHPLCIIGKLLFPERFRDYKGVGFTPDMVIESYFDTFELGMNEVFSHELHTLYKQKVVNEISASNYKTGLALYQHYYGKALL